MRVDFKGGHGVVRRAAGLISGLTLAIVVSPSANAAILGIPLGNTVVTENFDEMGAADGASLPTYWKWAHDPNVRIADSYTSGATSFPTGAVTAGGTLGAGVYNIGAGSDQMKVLDRSIGMVLTDSSSAALKSCTILAQFQSSTPVTSISFKYDLKCFTNGSSGASFQVQPFFAVGTNSNNTVPTSMGMTFDNTFSATPMALQTYSATYTPGSTITANNVFTLGFCYSAASGSSSASGPTLGFDNFSIATNGVALTPEPAMLSVIGGATLLGLRRRRA